MTQRLERKEDDANEYLDRWAEIELKADGEDAGLIKGYASVFDELDQGRDIVVAGAFSKSLKSRSSKRIPMLYGHNQSGLPVGVWTVIKEDKRGLYVEGKLALGSDPGRQMYEVLKAGAEMGISIGYRTIKKEIVVPKELGKDASEWSPGTIRKLLEVDLREISLVPIPMNDSARVTSVKTEAGVLDAPTRAIIHSLTTKAEYLEASPIVTALENAAAKLVD